MKKILAIALLAFTLNANAFWGNNSMPWNGNNYNNNYNGYGNYGYQQDNGIFSFNPYDYWDPRWYSEEMSNMMDEFSDNNNGWGNNNRYNRYNNYNGYGYNPYNNNYNQKPFVKTK
ncbi:hypothetical protein [Bathymodiolus thermophilus thioautotrophic gill symbiont]|uniref:Sulfur globule protein CV1 n=1 Tax=Bathymodiolus thermophilus thioautotrophic gill symbiont TaxID=2360 RepID=A0A1J5UNF9_9GAMM|nr:hypothetical protein [Bathymodiolus thermophilus thioautotrophic gill symbiont]OIR25759.1 hypothetical protein BGC33_15410 [Bathymodiolus thermophilus thioautotrophic gill symbiont]